MLVLSRRRDERVIIGDNEVVVTVVEVRGDKVRLGFDAPKSVQIHREEVFRSIQREGCKNAHPGSAAGLPDPGPDRRAGGTRP